MTTDTNMVALYRWDSVLFNFVVCNQVKRKTALSLIKPGFIMGPCAPLGTVLQ